MATRPVIDDLDRCKSALQYVAEGQPQSHRGPGAAGRTTRGDHWGGRGPTAPMHVSGRRPAAERAHPLPRLPADGSSSPRLRHGARRRGGGACALTPYRPDGRDQGRSPLWEGWGCPRAMRHWPLARETVQHAGLCTAEGGKTAGASRQGTCLFSVGPKVRERGWGIPTGQTPSAFLHPHHSVKVIGKPGR